MPKPMFGDNGTGMHTHQSVWKDGKPLMAGNGYAGFSEIGMHYIGGILKHARTICAFAAPTTNSYKRLVRGAPRSGATWAPIFITYGGSNRTQMIRIPGPGRIECRTVDGSVNPYLAATAMLAAGLDGIKNQLPAGKRNDQNLYEVSAEELNSEGIALLPANLNEALDALEEDEVILESLGDPYGKYYLQVKRDEWKEYHDSISGWEVKTYLGKY